MVAVRRFVHLRLLSMSTFTFFLNWGSNSLILDKRGVAFFNISIEIRQKRKPDKRGGGLDMVRGVDFLGAFGKRDVYTAGESRP